MAYIALSGAVKTFLFEKSAAGRSPHTLSDYRIYLDTLVNYLEDPTVDWVKAEDIRSYLSYMQITYKVRRGGVETDKLLSPKTISNIQATLNTFWKWAAAEYKVSNPCTFERINAQKPPIDPLNEEDVDAMLRSCDAPSKAVKTRTQSAYEFKRRTRKRDRAIIMALLDTGARASELCDAKIGDLDVDSGRIKVTGKGRKTRFVYLGRKGKSAVWAYLLERFPRGKMDQEAPLIVDDDGLNPMNRDSLRHLLLRIGKRAGIKKTPHPHLFRHTFAVQYLRNGGDVFTLQQLLGHTTLTMVMRYVQLAQGDMERVHKRANPSDNWKIR